MKPTTTPDTTAHLTPAAKTKINTMNRNEAQQVHGALRLLLDDKRGTFVRALALEAIQNTLGDIKDVFTPATAATLTALKLTNAVTE